MKDVYSIIQKLTEKPFNSPFEEEHIKKLRPVKYVLNYYRSPMQVFHDPRNDQKYIIKWKNEKGRVKELKRINQLIAEYNLETDENNSEFLKLIPPDGKDYSPTELGFEKPTIPIKQQPLWGFYCIPKLSRDNNSRSARLMVDDEELYKLLYDELQDVDKFIEYLNKKIFDYIQARWKNAMEMGAWDSDNMWYEPNKRFVKWFQINNIDPDSKVLKKDETNNALWAIADDMRLRKKEGEFETYREAYRWAEKNISKKGVTITAIKLEKAYNKAKSEGKL